jgi:hypothetical protein
MADTLILHFNTLISKSDALVNLYCINQKLPVDLFRRKISQEKHFTFMQIKPSEQSKTLIPFNRVFVYFIWNRLSKE